ncbi:hypothetical protein [Paenibacillus agilis]|uniref:Uncharacterized protein n=1 Tax=Paenibacillus agilis TaxID=3020863 RepID=A0A559J2U9_9BACL|nr:hypothetical protein [Paenibacillus agilis]TVX94214.1 hypothetical protein FPZ44_14825 [Paenibacillus agilis]
MNVLNAWRRVITYMLVGMLVAVLSGCTSFLMVEPELKEEVWDVHEPKAPIYEEVYGKIVIPDDVYQP